MSRLPAYLLIGSTIGLCACSETALGKHRSDGVDQPVPAERDRAIGQPCRMRLDSVEVEGGGASTQGGQVVDRIENLVALAVAAGVEGDDLPVGHDRDAIDVPLDGYGPESIGPRDTVTVVVEADGLVLVHSCELVGAGIERPVGKR